MSSACKALAALLLAAAACAPVRAEVWELPGEPALRGHWFPLPGSAPKPAVLALHGCGGLYRKGGQELDERYVEYREELARLGIQLLLVDSWGSRGLGPQCGVRYDERSVPVATRRQDALAALAWLRQQAGVDANRLVLMGWSNGATTGLTVIDAQRTPAPPPLAGAALYYPGCGKLLKAGAPALPVLLQLGSADDWTPAAPCEQLAARWQREGAAVQRISYPGAFHGFDSRHPVRLRRDVPNGVDPRGVHQGGDPAARAASFDALRAFLRRVLSLDA